MVSRENRATGSLSRRGFLKGTAVVAGGAAVLGSKPILRALEQRRAQAAAPMQEKWVNTACINCPAVCPMRVKVQDGRAVHIEGNPLSKVTDGALCPKGLLNLQNLYDPDRVKSPMKRTNPKKGPGEDPGWVPISWDEALETVAGKLRDLRERGEGHKFLLLRGRYSSTDADIMYSRFGKAYGTPNTISHSALCAEACKVGQWMANGQYKYSAYDLERSNYLLMFGLSPLEAHRPTSRLQRMWGHMRQERGHRVKTVVIDPRMSATATLADEWVPINPGTDAALATAIAHEMLVNGLWDRAFVGDFNESGMKFVAGQEIAEADFTENMTSGLIKWWNLALKDMTPAFAAKETGIPEETIIRIAAEFTSTKPAIAWRSRGTGGWNNGAYNNYAIFALNALVGSYDAPGGILVQPGAPLKLPATPKSDDLAAKSLKMPRLDQKGTKRFPQAGVVTNNTADSVLKGEPYEIEVAVGWMNNWNHSAPGCDRWSQALAKIPFFAHITPFASEMTQYADMILPTPTTLEKWAYEKVPDAGGIPEVRLRQPVVEKMFDTKQTTEIAFELARRIGGGVAEAFEGIGDNPEGYVRMVVESIMPWDEMVEKGVWVGPDYMYHNSKNQKTPSGKFEFYSQNLKELFEKLKMTDADIEAINIKARGDLALVPHYEPARFLGDKAEFPLVLATYKPALNSEGRSANNTWAMESLLPVADVACDNPAELNPDTAAQNGIADGDLIEVESPFGKLQTRVKVHPGVHPQSLLMAFGLGHTAYGRNARSRGVNPNAITGVDYEHLSGMSTYYNTRVRVRKV